jgi:hypothetical protein
MWHWVGVFLKAYDVAFLPAMKNAQLSYFTRRAAGANARRRFQFLYKLLQQCCDNYSVTALLKLWQSIVTVSTNQLGTMASLA